MKIDASGPLSKASSWAADRYVCFNGDRAVSRGLPTIRCTGRDGEKEFIYQYSFDELDKVWHFTVESDPRPDSNNTFDMTFKVLPDGSLRQIMITANDELCYLGQGIPEAMLPEVKRIFGMEVQSSPPDDDGAWRSGFGERMWRRLRDKGIAEYLPETATYRVR